MDHVEFVRRYRAGEIAVDVDKDNAGFLYEQPGLIPQEFRAKQAMIRTVAFGCTLSGIALFFFVEWWIALVVLIAGVITFPQAQKSGAHGVLLASLQSPVAYKVAAEGGVLKIREL